MTDEDGFLAHIRLNPADAIARLVYADWLDERDDHDSRSKSSYLRLDAMVAELPPNDPNRDAAVLAMRDLANVLPLAWKSAVSRLPLENCDVAWHFACPKKWEELTPTDQTYTRHCSACQKDVRYCTTITEAYAVASRGGCVVVDLHIRRKPGDLEAREPERFTTAGILIDDPEPRTGSFREWIRRQIRGDR